MKLAAFITALTAILFYTAIYSAVECAPVPAIPNESVFEGVVFEYSLFSSRLIRVEPEQTLYGLTVLIESSKAGKGMDFLKEKKGEYVRFFSKEKLQADLFGKRIKASAVYRGGERGGMHWVHDIQVIK